MMKLTKSQSRTPLNMSCITTVPYLFSSLYRIGLAQILVNGRISVLQMCSDSV